MGAPRWVRKPAWGVVNSQAHGTKVRFFRRRLYRSAIPVQVMSDIMLNWTLSRPQSGRSAWALEGPPRAGADGARLHRVDVTVVDAAAACPAGHLPGST
mgnify:CR=1 FL=1